MIYLVKSCITINERGEAISTCGGWCCYMLNFAEFPNGNWHSKPCDYLKEGVCSCYETRPKSCEGSPFFDGSHTLYPPNKFIVPWCVYRSDVLHHHEVEFGYLESGEACIGQYSMQGLGDFERWAERRYFKKRTLYYE